MKFCHSWIISCFLLNFVFIHSVESLGIPYQKCPWVDQQVWSEMQPYFLPENSLVKSVLDKIFWNIRATASDEMFKLAGFRMLPMDKKRKVVARHPALKGYLIKTYLDTHHILSEDWKIWLHRIKGAQQIQECIEKHGLQHLFKVPKKWLYPLPPAPEPEFKEGVYPRNCVLVVEDMQILDSKHNKKKYWKITPEQLDGLYILLSENLLHDSIHIFNIPFSKDGKIAFIDTEHFNSTRRRVRYERLTPYFNPEMQQYWQNLIEQGERKQQTMPSAA